MPRSPGTHNPHSKLSTWLPADARSWRQVARCQFFANSCAQHARGWKRRQYTGSHLLIQPPKRRTRLWAAKSRSSSACACSLAFSRESKPLRATESVLRSLPSDVCGCSFPWEPCVPLARRGEEPSSWSAKGMSCSGSPAMLPQLLIKGPSARSGGPLGCGVRYGKAHRVRPAGLTQTKLQARARRYLNQL